MQLFRRMQKDALGPVGLLTSMAVPMRRNGQWVESHRPKHKQTFCSRMDILKGEDTGCSIVVGEVSISVQHVSLISDYIKCINSCINIIPSYLILLLTLPVFFIFLLL